MIRPILSLLLGFFVLTQSLQWAYSAGEENHSIASMHTVNATDSLDRIHVQVVYYVPRDATPLADWRERIDFLMKRAQAFHQREFTHQSQFQYTLLSDPFIASATRMGFPNKDVNQFYWHIINEVWHSDKIQFDPQSFPILLVLSDHNFSPGYDDWTRLCNGNHCSFDEPHTKCNGFIKADGDHRPGTRCGGSRSVYWPQKHIGLGLVTADGWRVPLIGSDCVVYHEGIGHSIGLPHPEPIDNSVMGLAQYVDGLQATWIDADQKTALGWQPEEIHRDDLFSTFSVMHSPICPSSTESVSITATLPYRFKIKTIQAEYQLSLRERFQSLDKPQVQEEEGKQMVSWIAPPMPSGQSIAYRVRVETESGEKEEIWHYYKVK